MITVGGGPATVTGKPFESTSLRNVTLLAAIVLGERSAALSWALTFSDQNLNTGVV